MAVSSAAHPDRVKSIVRKAVNKISAAASQGGMSIVEGFDKGCDTIDKKDEEMSDGGTTLALCSTQSCLYPLHG